MSEDLQRKDDFEKKLRSDAQRFDMAPSDMVWQNINRELHPQSGLRKPLLWVICLLVLAGATSGLDYWFSIHRPVNSSSPGVKTANPASSLSAPATSPRDVTALSGNPAAKTPATPVMKSRLPQLVSLAPLPSSSVPLPAADNRNPGPDNMPDLASLGLSDQSAGRINPSIENRQGILSGNFKQETAKEKFSLRKLLKHPLKWDFFAVPSISFRWMNIPSAGEVSYFYYMQSPFLTTPISQASSANTLSKNNLGQYSQFSFAAGVHVHRYFGTKFSLVSGLELDRFGYGIVAVPVFPTAVLQTSTQPGSGNSSFFNSSYVVPPGPSYNVDVSREVNISNFYYFLSLPILADYSVKLPSGWKIDFSGGLDVGYIVYGSVNILSPYSKAYYSDNNLVRRWEPDLNASIYFSIPFTKGTYLQIGPEFRYQPLSTYIGGYDVREHPYDLGIRIGIGKK